jgi:4-amino-4-deoxy-L-arabinose transferase-like glycosyltransferase
LLRTFRDKKLFYTVQTRLRAVLDKWRLLFLGFVLIYAFILLFNLATPILWDEISHLNSAALLYFGQYKTFAIDAFYPPLFDVIAFISYKVFGISLFAARLPTVFFSVLALWAIFELAYYLYDGKVALLSAVILGIMPGFFLSSGYAMLETALTFFVTASLLCFYRWVSTHRGRSPVNVNGQNADPHQQVNRDQGVTRQNWLLVLTGLILGLGFLAKYQMVIAGVVMLFGIVLFAQKPLRAAFRRFSLAVVVAILVVVPWFLMAYDFFIFVFMDRYFYAMSLGNPERSVYSTRFPLPIFYFIEMVWPHSNFHPISVFVYILCLVGLGFMVYRRKREDKFVLLWFVVVFVFFTFVSNREWRYVMSLFPALAISASVVILSMFSALRKTWRSLLSVNRKWLVKVVSLVMAVMVVGAMVYSVYDTYSFVSASQGNIDVKGAANYVSSNIESGRSVLVLCPSNHFSRDIVQFYLWTYGDCVTEVLQYPLLPVDAYTPDFNVDALVDLCRENNVQYVLLFNYGSILRPFFGTDLNTQKVYEQFYFSGTIAEVTEEHVFGDSHRQIFVITFTG